MDESTLVRDFTRGGQIFMHSIRMFGQALRYLIFFSLILFVIVTISVYYLRTTERDRYIFSEYIEASLKVIVNDRRVLHSIRTDDGKSLEVLAAHFIEHPRTIAAVKKCSDAFIFSIWMSFFMSLISLVTCMGYFRMRGETERQITEIRGQERIEPEDLRELLTETRKASLLSLATVPLLKGTETQHILLAGTTGVGKTQCIEELMDQVRAKNERAIVYDIEGTYIPHYYRPGKDIILNPLDERSPAWNTWCEGEDSADFEGIASSLMPLHLSNSDPFWIHSARTIYAAAASRLRTLNKKQNKFLLEPMFTESLGGLSSLLIGSVAESLVSEKNEKTALSIKATLAAYCKSLLYLRDDSQGPLFSIRKWILDEKDDAWLFIASNELKKDALKPLISVWLDVAARSVLSLKPSTDRRLWFFMDELPTLHRLPSLVDTLSRARKYGGCFVAGIQDIHQLRSVYGRDEAESLTSLFNTNVFFRTKSPESAQWLSKIMGGREIIEKKESHSYGANDMRDGVSIHQERRREPIVSDSEFLMLDNLQAYLRLPGDLPVTKLQFEYKKRERKEPALIERKLTETLILEVETPKEDVVEEEEKALERAGPKARQKTKRVNKPEKSLEA